MELSKYIDHTLLKATAQAKDIKKLCSEAIDYNFYAVCVNGCYVSLTKNKLKNTAVKVAAVIGFPLGAMSTAAKVLETQKCIEDGADEIDMVINIGKLQAGDFHYVENEIAEIKIATGEKPLKVIIETCYLSKEEKKTACTLAMNVGADFVKTSTGFGTGGATLKDVKLMKSVVGDRMEIKASGGIKDTKTALEYVALGISRIGTSSGIAIVTSK